MKRTARRACETGNSYDESFAFQAKIAFARFNLEWPADGRDRLP